MKSVDNLLYTMYNIIVTYRGVEQLAARWAHNPKVGSSSLPLATKL